MTRLAVLAVGVVMFGLIAALIWWLALRFERAGDRVVEPSSRWAVAERSADGRHVVLLERLEVRTEGAGQVLESREVGSVETGDPAYAERLADLTTLAADRARLLNAQARRS